MTEVAPLFGRDDGKRVHRNIFNDMRLTNTIWMSRGGLVVWRMASQAKDYLCVPQDSALCYQYPSCFLDLSSSAPLSANMMILSSSWAMARFILMSFQPIFMFHYWSQASCQSVNLNTLSQMREKSDTKIRKNGIINEKGGFSVEIFFVDYRVTAAGKKWHGN